MPLPPGRSGLPPESVAVGGKAPQDPVTPLFPFGETTPARWFYLSADEAIAPGSALVRIQVSLARPGVPGRAPGVRLNWTYKVGSEWRPLGQSGSGAEVIGTSDWGFRDGSRAFTRNGEISFWAPAVWPREL